MKRKERKENYTNLISISWLCMFTTWFFIILSWGLRIFAPEKFPKIGVVIFSGLGVVLSIISIVCSEIAYKSLKQGDKSDNKSTDSSGSGNPRNNAR